MRMRKLTSLWLAGFLLVGSLASVTHVESQEQPAAAEEQPIPQPPPYSRWFAQTRWDEAYALERSAGYDKLKVAAAIEAYKMLMDLYPTAGMANEAAWRIVNLTTRYREVPKTIQAYEGYIADFPDGDYAADALWNLTYQYMRIPDWEKVYEKYDEFLRRFAKSPYGDEALNGLANYAKSQRNYELAFNLYQQLLQRYPTSDYCDDAVSAIGYMYAQMGDVDNATQAYFTLARDYPYSSLVESGLQQLVMMYYRSGDVMKAVELGQAFLEAFPQSRYARYVQMYMYYAVRRARIAIPGLMEIPMPGWGEYGDDEYEALRQQHDQAYQAASSAAKTSNYAQAIALYEDFLAKFPSSDRTDDALYAIGSAYDSLETYVTTAEQAKTPEQLGQVEEDWNRVASSFQAAQGQPGGKPVQSAIEAYIVLARTMPGSDLRDDALYRAAADYEKLEDWVSAVKAYLDLITTFPVSSWANTAVSRLNALYTKLPSQEDRAMVLTTIINTYPHHSLADDYVYKLGVQALLNGNVTGARDLFARYGTDYPHRAKAADALFWHARCQQLLGSSVTARMLYRDLVANFAQSGLADDAYVEHEYIRSGQSDSLLRAGQEALNRAEKVVGKPLLGYEAITRDHILILAPSDKAIDIRAYNLPDRLEQAYAVLQKSFGGGLGGSGRVEILVDPTAKAFTAGQPARVPVSMVGPPPMWRHWYEAAASAFINDPAVANVTAAIPGLAAGAARFISIQLEEMLYADIGEMNIGASAVQQHLRDLNQIKRTATQALDGHIRAKATADKIDANIGLGMWWRLSERLATIPGEIIDWTPLQPVFADARSIPASATKQAQSLEDKAALVAYWLNTALGKDQTAVLKTWGLPVTSEGLAKIKAAVEQAQKPAAESATENPPEKGQQKPAKGDASGEAKPAAKGGTGQASSRKASG